MSDNSKTFLQIPGDDDAAEEAEEADGGVEDDGGGGDGTGQADMRAAHEKTVLLGVPCLWFNVGYCADFAMEQNLKLEEVRVDVFFVGKCVGFNKKEKRHMVMVPDDPNLYLMSVNAFSEYRAKWHAHGEQTTAGYYRWRKGKVTVVEAWEMNYSTGFEKAEEVRNACHECQSTNGILMCNMCEQTMFCEEHESDLSGVCVGCSRWENVGDEDVLGESLFWDCERCGRTTRTERGLCSGCGWERERDESVDNEEIVMDGGGKGGGEVYGGPIRIGKRLEDLQSESMICGNEGRTMVTCGICYYPYCQEHFQSSGCDDCVMAIAEAMKDAQCKVCGVLDTGDEERNEGRLHRCDSCEYAFCNDHGDAYELECTRCVEERMRSVLKDGDTSGEEEMEEEEKEENNADDVDGGEDDGDAGEDDEDEDEDEDEEEEEKKEEKKKKKLEEEEATAEMFEKRSGTRIGYGKRGRKRRR